MSITSLAVAKQHLRETSSLQDTVIGAYLDAAEGIAEHYCNRPLVNPLTKAVTGGVLLMLEAMYTNRDNPVAASVVPGGPVAACLNTYKDWAYGASGPAPTGVAVDGEPLLAGDTWSRQWSWKNEDGTAINVTGYTGSIEFLQGETVILTKALAIVVAGDGTFSVTLSAAETGALIAGDYWYRVRVISSAGAVTTLDRKLVVVQ